MENKKKIKLVLKNGFVYTGVIIDDSPEQLIILDKFNNRVQIDKNSISVQEEVSNWNYYLK